MTSIPHSEKPVIAERYGKLPLTFVPNRGQSQPGELFYASRTRFRSAMFADRFTLSFGMQDGEGVTLQYRFVEADERTKVEAVGEASGKVNYLRGNDASRHYVDLPSYRELAYREPWPGIDLTVQDRDGALKLHWFVAPNASPERIRVELAGADDVRLDAEGNLVIVTPYGVLLDEKPVAWQESGGVRREVPCEYRLSQEEGGAFEIGFHLANTYDAAHELVIDPSIVYSTYLGGDAGGGGLFAIAVDAAGFAYVAGFANGADFPTTPGAFQTAPAAGSIDVTVSKLNQAGSALIYSTFIGGSSDDRALAISLDTSGNAYVTGTTSSTDFPVSAGAFQQTRLSSTVAFVTKLNTAGNALEYSTYLGGSGGQNAVDHAGIAIDGLGHAYVAGGTLASDFPTTAGAFQTVKTNSNFAAFVSKLNPSGTGLVYSTFLTGNGSETANAITIDASDNAYVTGQTSSTTFPTTPGAFQIVRPQTNSGFVTKLNAAGSAPVYSTYFGGPSVTTVETVSQEGLVQQVGTGFSLSSRGLGIAVDNSGNAYVAGSTNSDAFPVTAGAFQTAKSGGQIDAFLFKLNTAGTGLVFSTYLGGINELEYANGIAVDPFLNVHVVGQTNSANFPITPDAFQAGINNQAVFYSILDPSGSVLLFSTELGGNDAASFGNAIALDSFGNAYLTGLTSSGGFPVTPGAFQPFLRGGVDGFVTKIGNVPDLVVSKFTDQFEYSPGDTVRYVISVTANIPPTQLPGPFLPPLTNIRIEDPSIGFFAFVPSLELFQTATFEQFFLIPPDAPPGPILNVVTAFADEINKPVQAQAIIAVAEVRRFGVNKVANKAQAAPGETIFYTITLTNAGNVPLTNVRVVDPLLQLDQTYTVLPPFSTVEIVWPFVIPLDASSYILNDVTVTGDNLPFSPAGAGTAVLVVPVPRLNVAKTADRISVIPGDIVTFTIEVTNTGNTVLSDTTVVDDVTGFSTVIPSLSPGEVRTFPVEVLVPLGTPPDTYGNTVTVTNASAPTVIAEAQVTVVSEPLIGLRKVPNTLTPVPGQTISYEATIANIGNVPLTDIRVSDPLIGFDQAVRDLAVGESIQVPIPFTVPADAVIGSEIVNVLTVRAAETGTQQVESTVTVAGNGLALTKVADVEFAAPGSTVNFTLTVTNLISLVQTNVVIVDSDLGISETVPSIAPGGVIVRTGTFVIPAAATNGTVIVNEFLASSDQTPLQKVDENVVVVIDVPGATTELSARKLVDRNGAAPGETVRYTVELTNNGTIPATNVVVSDSLLGSQTTVPVIAPGTTERFELTFTIPANAVQGTVFANRITATYPQQPAGFVVQSEARVVVALPAELLRIVAAASPATALPGESVTKTVLVRNESARLLTNVRVIDPRANFSVVLPELGPGQTREVTFPFPIPAGAAGGTTIVNTLIVSSDQTPFQQRAMPIDVTPVASVLLSKTVDHAVGRPGETVVFTIRGRNTGNIPIEGGIVNDPLLGLQLRTITQPVGADVTLRIPFILPDVDNDTVITNTVTAESSNGPTVMASASVTVIEDEE